MQKKRVMSLRRIVFSRTFVAALFLLIQLIVMFSLFRWFEERAYGFFIVVSLLTALWILDSEMNAYYKMSWMIPVLMLPVFGALFFIFLKNQNSSRRIARELRHVIDESAPYFVTQRRVMEQLRSESPQDFGLMYYATQTAGFRLYDNSSAQYFSDGAAFFEKLKAELRKAKKYIFMEYFIVDRGNVWDGPEGILDILKQKVQEGVEVRFMYDGMCSVALLPHDYPAQLEASGIHCKMFSPMIPALVSYQNNRDHRKLTVIDGHTAFTGGVNLADEYANLITRFGHWKDAGVMVKGSAAEGMAMLFLQQWNLSEQQEHEYERYALRHGEDCFDDETARDGLVMPYADNPFDNEEIGAQMYIGILNAAQRYCHIMTPYLILEDTLMNALCFAAKRGVEVVIMMPHVPDKKYAYWVARSYYRQLIRNGVRIIEYQPGFVHSKLMVSDDIRAVVGTINLDFRSLYLHFENACYLYKKKMILDLEHDFQQSWQESCREITMEDVHQYPLFKQLLGSLLRIAAPLM